MAVPKRENLSQRTLFVVLEKILDTGLARGAVAAAEEKSLGEKLHESMSILTKEGGAASEKSCVSKGWKADEGGGGQTWGSSFKISSGIQPRTGVEEKAYVKDAGAEEGYCRLHPSCRCTRNLIGNQGEARARKP